VAHRSRGRERLGARDAGACGTDHLPFLKANATAIKKGHDTVRLSLPGGTYVQAPFKYQAKCYATLKNKLAALPPQARAVIDPLLKETGCFRYLA